MVRFGILKNPYGPYYGPIWIKTKHFFISSDFDQDEYVSLETPVQVQPAHTYREPDKKLVKKSKNNEKKKKEKENKPNEKDNKPNEKDKKENTATAGRRLPPSPPEDGNTLYIVNENNANCYWDSIILYIA